MLCEKYDDYCNAFSHQGFVQGYNWTVLWAKKWGNEKVIETVESWPGTGESPIVGAWVGQTYIQKSFV